MATGPDRGETIDDTNPGEKADPTREIAVAATFEPVTVTVRGGKPFGGELTTGTMVGEYKIEGKLGEGGMGTVYGAVHPVIGKRAAVKVIKRDLCASPESVERFVLEARAVNQIGHPNIVDVFAFGALPDGRSYFVMEWLRGESLADRLRRGRVPFGEALDILDGVIRGLEAAHDKQIIHRDLKPDNVYLVEVRGERPLVKLLDFGIAKLTGGEDNRMERTRTGAMIGTPQYIAPEQARGLAVDFRTDVYSLGVMAFEIFTGRPPFQAATAMDMISKHLNDPPPRASTINPVPAPLDRVIHEMLDKDAANRPTLPELRAVIDEVRTASVNVALVGTVPEASLPAGVVAARQRSRKATLGIVGAVVLAAAVAVAGWYATREKAAESPAQAVPAVVVPEPKAAVVPDAGAEAAAVPVPDAGAEVVVTTEPETEPERTKSKTKSKSKSKTKISDETKPEIKPDVKVKVDDDDDGVVSPFDRKKTP